MTNWDTPPDGLSPWNMPGFDKDEPFYPDDVLPPTVANTPNVATRLNDEQLIIATIDEFLQRKLCESVFLTSLVPIPYIRPTNSDDGRAQRAPAIMAGWDSARKL